MSKFDFIIGRSVFDIRHLIPKANHLGIPQVVLTVNGVNRCNQPQIGLIKAIY